MMFSAAQFYSHMAVALQLLALVAGVYLLSRACSPDFACQKLGKIVGGFVVIVSILSMLCVGYLSYRRYSMEKQMMRMPKMWQHPPLEQMMPPDGGGEQKSPPKSGGK